jgi:peptidoglycan/xylan/chitin deacetylase (PgdA/CDA1 family)
MYVCVTADIERFSDAVSKYGCSATIDDIQAARTLLDVFCTVDIPSTLFILGKYAHEEPHIMDIVKENGHELASHGYSHVDLRTLPSFALEEELSKSAVGAAKGFRAPYYGFDNRMITYLERHFMYDSSTVPVRTRGLLFQRIHMLTDSLMEIPISTVGVLPLTSMGARSLPAQVLQGVAWFILKKDNYLIINAHPWEFVKVPEKADVPFYVKKNTGQGFLKKFYQFLMFLKHRHVEFVTMEQIYEHHRL